jgi:hypothetical protein
LYSTHELNAKARDVKRRKFKSKLGPQNIDIIHMQALTRVVSLPVFLIREEFSNVSNSGYVEVLDTDIIPAPDTRQDIHKLSSSKFFLFT